MAEITISTRLRRSPFYNSTVADGVVSFTPYNQMMMPTGYGDPEAEYWRLIEGVSMWDVSVERQIQLRGPDAAELTQILCSRDMSKCVVEQGKYVAICDHRGTIINDPIVLKIDDDCFWLSIADSNILFWARCVASERGLHVEVTEPDISPLAIQGPKAEDVVASICGDWVRDLKYFWFGDSLIDGIPMKVARSGWSKQGGFELYLMDGSRGDDLWNIVKEAGKPFDIGPGNPNHCERIESGLLSWGGDTDDFTNPYEVRMGNYVDLDIDANVIGMEALQRIKSEGPKRHQLGVILDGDEPLPNNTDWLVIESNGRQIGHMTNGVWSRRLKKNIGFALVRVDSVPGDTVTVIKDNKVETGALTKLPFI